MLLPQTPQSILVVSTVISTFTFLATITLLPLFFMKIQRINSQMLTDLRSCHQDSTDIWKQLSQENVRGKRSYGRDVPSIPIGKCCSCQQGKPGPLGPKGQDGFPGQPGIIGLNGRNGRNGKYVASEAHNEPACQKCPVAPPGPPGHPGRKGPRGSVGNAGTAGKNGIPGRMGPPGPAGVRGPPGEIGMQGPQGDPGKVLNGAPQGQPGRPGKVGPRGKGGHTGRDGRPGLEGIAGARGVQGERGSRGARGPPGPPGPAGTDGRKGSCAHCQSEDKPNHGANNRRPEETNPEPEYSDQRAEPVEPVEPVTVHRPVITTTTTTEAAPVYTNPPTQAPRSFASAAPTIQYNTDNSEVIPKTINYPDTINHQSYKHDGDVSVAGTDDSEDVNVIPAGQYSSRRQYASKTNKIGKAIHFGYSNDQLSAFAPMGGASEEEDGYGQPRAFQTNKGYNVQIMGSGAPTYNAAPVGNAWKQPENHKVRQYTPQYLPPPAYV